VSNPAWGPDGLARAAAAAPRARRLRTALRPLRLMRALCAVMMSLTVAASCTLTVAAGGLHGLVADTTAATGAPSKATNVVIILADDFVSS
jgi:hypothetical protein